MSQPADGQDRPLSFLAACLREPERGKRRLPTVVGLLDADDERTRLAAGWACCAVAAARPETVEYLADRLGDRLDAEATTELVHALSYLSERFPDRVASALEGPSAGDRPSDGADRLPTPVWEVVRTDDGDSVATVITRRPTVDAGGGEAAGPNSRDSTADRADRPAAGATESGTDDPDAGEGASEAEGADGGRSSSDSAASGRLAGRPAVISSITTRSRFDRLDVLASRTHGRYAEEYRALADRDGDQAAIALRILDRPDDLGDRPAFEERIREHLERWASVDDHAAVAPVLDWDVEPRPWLATEVAGEPLAAHGEVTAGYALAIARSLADAVAHLHRNDVVHGGIDPGNVRLPEGVLARADGEPPVLDNLGMVPGFRYHVDPATVLDARYAPPEYYDRRFGSIDPATDVYGLGAVVFRLFAGRAPYEGSVAAVREAVTGEATPVPGDVAEGVSAAIDDVVARAMATDKLRRYESVDLLRNELHSLEDPA